MHIDAETSYVKKPVFVVVWGWAFFVVCFLFVCV